MADGRQNVNLQEEEGFGLCYNNFTKIYLGLYGNWQESFSL